MAPLRIHFSLYCAQLTLLPLLTPTASYLLLGCWYAGEKRNYVAACHFLQACSCCVAIQQPVSVSAGSAYLDPEGKSGSCSPGVTQFQAGPEPEQPKRNAGTPNEALTIPTGRSHSQAWELKSRRNRPPRISKFTLQNTGGVGWYAEEPISASARCARGSRHVLLQVYLISGFFVVCGVELG
ncbi:hypothetical protein NDU88_002207 [Pleurodeles waltl]|uniref:Uncharacterized protein n=1 Tax=Pleurodeles waltl TaxID=8319 RepID=A0AAV7VYP5_PLEWA|nr:hypothetical protein NDU88_002207 [Pleurodeles waltl]